MAEDMGPFTEAQIETLARVFANLDHPYDNWTETQWADSVRRYRSLPDNEREWMWAIHLPLMQARAVAPALAGIGLKVLGREPNEAMIGAAYEAFPTERRAEASDIADAWRDAWDAAGNATQEPPR